MIGELKPNASALELMLLKNKIASTIQTMRLMEKQEQLQRELQAVSVAQDHRIECYIEVTRVEKVPGKCHRAGTGLPICQSDNYMTISNECI